MTVRSRTVKAEQLAREIRDRRRQGVAVAVVDDLDSNGNVRFARIRLGWDGQVSRPPPLPWE